jgi:AraC family transcriptional regulator
MLGMSSATWRSAPNNARGFRSLSILYGDSRGGFLPEHAHEDVQVSIHFAGTSQPGLERLDVDLFPSQMPHTGCWRPGTEVIVFHLAPGLLTEVGDELGRGVGIELAPAKDTYDRVIEGLGLIARDEYLHRNALSDLFLESAGFMMARHLLRRHAAFPIPKPRPYKLTDWELNNLRRFVRDHLHCGFSVRELASVIGAGPAVLSQKLRSSIGQSPWRFVQEERIRRATELLKHSRSPIVELAVQLGYTDQSHFTNSFRRATGLTPKAYRTRTSL